MDCVLAVAWIALTADAIIVPFLTGKTLHEHIGLPPSDYKLLGSRTVLIAEQATWGAVTLYQTARSYLKTRPEPYLIAIC